MFGDIVAGLRGAGAHARGETAAGLVLHVPPSIDVAAIRKRTGKAQTAFAESIGVPVGTLRQWESRRQPRGAALVLLALLERNPRLVEETLGQAA
ncbi:transcriptional regulator [Methylobacterium radiodurans]|uniref:Transcriptional regulator n=1 Tax=Methylobacterium radiodurans TaxID=2202828 RepID=A0A2U8VYH0_9HYPH|nr:transcriptional regulator [Methylobacterium radiodurans]